MDYIKTATGKIFKVASVSTIPRPQLLYIRVLDASIAEVSAVFSDPSETSVIYYADNQLVGYTKLQAIVNEGYCLRVNLER